MEQILETLTQLLTDFTVRDTERYFVLSAPRKTIIRFREALTKGFSEDNNHEIKKVFIPGIGFIELQETEDKEISIKLN